MQRYRTALDRALLELGNLPEIGARRDHLFPGLRARPVERHIIDDRIEDDRIEVVRILHERADAGRHLQS